MVLFFLDCLGPRIIAEQEHSGDQLLVKNHSVKVRHLVEEKIRIMSAATSAGQINDVNISLPEACSFHGKLS